MLTAPYVTLLLGVLACVLRPALAAVSAEDLVVAFPIDEPHLPLAYASRAWRKVSAHGAWQQGIGTPPLTGYTHAHCS